MKKNYYIAVDFDCTLAKTNEFPYIGEPNTAIINEAIKRAKEGATLILYTCREGKPLERAVEACKKWGVPIKYINENPEVALIQQGKPSRKIFANEYWDDRAVNVTGSKMYPKTFSTLCGVRDYDGKEK